MLHSVPPPLLVIDTNLIYTDRRLKSSVWTALGGTVSAGEVDVAVPEIVVRESARHAEQDVKVARKAIQDAVKAVEKHRDAARLDLPGLSSLPSIRELRDVEEITGEQARAEFRDRLMSLGFHVLPIPVVPHDLLVDWSLRSHRPFDETDKGYRDALIWFTFITAAQENLGRFVVYVSNDNDCLQKKEAVPHDELADQLEKLGIGQSVGFARSIEEALKVAKRAREDRSWLPPEETAATPEPAEPIPSIRVLTGSERFQLLHDPVWETVSTSLLGAPLIQDLPSGSEERLIEGLLLPAGLEAATIAEVEQLNPLIRFTRDAYEGQLIVGSVRAVVAVYYEGVLLKSEYYGWPPEEEPRRQLVVTDPDWNDRSVQVSNMDPIEVEVELSFVIDPEAFQVIALDITRIHTQYNAELERSSE